jgi:hypothetical protein
MQKDAGELIQKSANKLVELAMSIQAEGNRLYDLVQAEKNKEKAEGKE